VIALKKITSNVLHSDTQRVKKSMEFQTIFEYSNDIYVSPLWHDSVKFHKIVRATIGN
jgi:hypothetical protein